MRNFCEVLKEAKAMLLENRIQDGDLDAWFLFSHYFQVDRVFFLMHQDKAITEEEYKEFMNLIKKRMDHIPMQYIIGVQEFMGLSFQVNESVLIPRQDTEILVEEVLKVCEGKEVLDLCTGSGCIIISLYKLGYIKKGLGVDISTEALLVAKENARLLKASVEFIESDMYSQVNNKYDIIVSNPPYIPTKVIESLMIEVKDHEPKLALDGLEDGLKFYRIIADGLKEHLRPNGYIFLEIGYDQGTAVSNLLQEAGMTDIKIIKDLAGLDRVVMGQSKKEKGEPFT